MILPGVDYIFGNLVKLWNLDKHPGTVTLFLVHLLVLLSDEQVIQYKNMYNIDFSSRYMIEQGIYKMKLTKSQAQFLIGAKIAALYPLKTMSPADLLQNSDYIIKTTPDFNYNDSNIINFSNNFYIYTQGFTRKLLNTANIIHASKISKIRLNNKYSSDFVLSGINEHSKTSQFRALHSIGLDGAGQVVTITDTGIDIYHPFFHDKNFSVPINKTDFRHRKIVRFDSLHNFTDYENGHGTHIAGTVAGNTQNENCPIDQFGGIATGSKLYIIGLSDKNGNLSFDGYDLSKILETMPKVNSYISANSWGLTDNLYLTTEVYDVNAYNNPELLTIFSVGNEHCYNCISSPADGKNILSIGASTSPLSSRIEQPGKRIYEFVNRDRKIPMKFYFWSKDPFKMQYEYPPFKLEKTPIIDENDNEKISKANLNESLILIRNPFTCDKLNRTAKAFAVPIENNPKCVNISVPVFGYSWNEDKELLDMKRITLEINTIPAVKQLTFKPAYSSSFGPTVTGIFKPDLLAPGEKIISSSAGNPDIKKLRECSINSLSKKSGTSSAAATVAGLAAIIRQYFVDGWYPSMGKEMGEPLYPTSSLIKAMLVASARPVGTELGGPTMESGFGIPVIKDILGINMETLEPDKKQGLRVFDHILIDSKTQHFLNINVQHSGKPLVIVLSYLDAVIDSTSRRPLVADLDMIVVDPLNKTVFGNQNPTGPDAFTTTERVIINDAPAGNYSVLIRASKFPFNVSIQYSLVISGGFDNDDFKANPLHDAIVLANDNFFDCDDSTNGMCACDSKHTGYLCEYEINEGIGNINLVFHPKEIKFFRTSSPSKSYIYIHTISPNTTIHYCVRKRKFRRISDADVTCNYTEINAINYFPPKKELYYAFYAVSSKESTANVTFGRIENPQQPQQPQNQPQNGQKINWKMPKDISIFEIIAIATSAFMVIIVIMRFLRRPPVNRSQRGRKSGLAVPVHNSSRAMEADNSKLLENGNPLFDEMSLFDDHNMQEVSI